MVNMECYVASESPVVDAVLEQVRQWHGCVREAMDEDCLEESLGVVDRVASSSNTENMTTSDIESAIHHKANHSLSCLTDGDGGCVTVEEPRALIEPEIHKQRTGILSQEHCRPADLRSQVLHVKLASAA